MIIRCEECATRFRLDEARIPDRGARVRCSRCDHSFVVRRPTSEGGDNEAAASLAKEAASKAAAAVAAAEAARLSQNSASDSETAEAGGADGPEEDEDWEFGPSEADVPGAAAQGAETSQPTAPSPKEETAPQDDAPAAAHPPATPVEAASDEMSDLVTHEDGVDRALAALEAGDDAAASAPADPAPEPEPADPAPPPELVQSESAGGTSAEDGGTSAFDIDDPFGLSGADFSGTGTLDTDDRDFEAAAAGVVEQRSADANEDSLAAIGDPASWNLLSDEEVTPDPGPTPPPPSPPPAPVPPAPSPTEEPLFPPTDLFSSEAPLGDGDAASSGAGPGPLFDAGPSTDDDFLAGFSATPEEPESETGSELFARLARGGSLVAWPLCLLLTFLASWNLLRPQTAVSSGRQVAFENGFEVHSLESRVVENTLGGPLLVVSGALRNGANRRQALESAVAVTLLGTAGQRFDEAQTLMAPTPEATALREQDPTYLRGLGDHAARRMAFYAFAPGEERSFSAVFDGVPGGATRFSIELHRLPGPPSAPPFVGPPAEEGLPESAAPVKTATALPSGAPLSRE